MHNVRFLEGWTYGDGPRTRRVMPGESVPLPFETARLAVELGYGECDELGIKPMFWRVEPEWRGKTVACIAGGPSLTREQCEAVAHLPTIGVNDAYRIARLDVLYACDEDWWNHHRGVKGFTGIKATQSERAARRFGLRLLRLEGHKGLNLKPGHICGGGNSGHQALNLAYHLGAARVLLLGYDMKGKAAHWFGDHPREIYKASDYGVWRNDFELIAREIQARGVEVINCSPDSALEWFPKMKLEDAL